LFGWYPKLSHPLRHNVDMEIDDIEEVVGMLRLVPLDAANRHQTLTVLSGLQRIRGLVDSLEICAAERLQQLTHNAPAELAGATQRPPRAGDQVFERAATLASVPSLIAPMRSGALQGAHVDTVAKILRIVRDEHAAAFAEALPSIVDSAASSRATPDDLARSLNRETRRLSDDDGVSRHEQQRRDTSLRTWTDKRTGMFRLSGKFDPLSGVNLHGRLQAALASLFAERTPSTCPADPGAKQDHLRAVALLALTMGATGSGLAIVPSDAGPDNGSSPVDDEWDSFFRQGPNRFGRPEVVVVLDARQATVNANDRKPFVDWGLPVELPWRALEDLYERADVYAISVANGVVIHAPGEMNLGRTTRLASKAQRRALRALYPTCAVPGCCVGFDFTKPHHVHYWENGGFTDLANLLPLCSKHHHLVHDGGWKLNLLSDRTLIITLPDGGVQTTGPPARVRAA
jgi:hypothetical protein